MTGQRVSEAVEELSVLRAHVARERTLLAELAVDVARERQRLRLAQTGDLAAVNGELVVAALDAKRHADSATRALRDAETMARHDPLTGLARRYVLLEQLRASLVRCERDGRLLALLFIDLDGFKTVNDTLGHASGDRVLVEVSQRISVLVRRDDLVCRYGGDEFVVLLEAVGEVHDAAQMATAMSTALARPFALDGCTVRLSASIGVSLFPHDAREASDLIECADGAMYQAKRLGARNVVFHDEVSVDDGVADPACAPTALLRGPRTHFGPMSLEQHRRHSDLRETNGRLVASALDAQHLLAVAENARDRQKTLMASVAHELRGPLAPLLLAVGMMERASVADAAKLQALLEREVAHFSRLVGDLLEHTRGATGKLRLERSGFDLQETLDAVIAVVRPALDARAQVFHVVRPPGPVPMHADAARVRQIVANLLDNAIKYTPRGGRIALGVVAERDAVVVRVEDSGIGLDPAVVGDIFQPFVQEQRAVAFDGRGLGIGLTLVRDLVEAHGGTVGAHSAGVGQGSSFVVRLPRDGSAGN